MNAFHKQTPPIPYLAHAFATHAHSRFIIKTQAENIYISTGTVRKSNKEKIAKMQREKKDCTFARGSLKLLFSHLK